MGYYLGKRAATGLLAVIIVFIFNFFLMHLAPGDPISVLCGMDCPQEIIEATKIKYGLDQPVTVQFVSYIKNVLRLDLGRSIRYGQPVLLLIKQRLVATLLLSLTSAVLALVIGTAMGLFLARKPGTIIDNILSFISYVLYSMPSFWLGLILILLFATHWKMLPSAGMVNARVAYTSVNAKYIADVLKHMILPVSTLTLVGIPVYFRIARASLAQVLKDDYHTLFRATGMSERKVFRKYSLRNAILPTLTTFGIRMSYIIAGATTVEIVFAWPGMGQLVMNAINNRDYPLLMGVFLIMAVSVAVWMILIDIFYAVADPRIRYH